VKRWCIINETGLFEAQLYDNAPIGCEVLLERYRPKCFYYDKKQAEDELIRLTEKYGDKFILFESVNRARTITMPVMGFNERACIVENIEN
jgi:hypothetical protein